MSYMSSFPFTLRSVKCSVISILPYSKSSDAKYRHRFCYQFLLNFCYKYFISCVSCKLSKTTFYCEYTIYPIFSKFVYYYYMVPIIALIISSQLTTNTSYCLLLIHRLQLVSQHLTEYPQKYFYI